MQWVTQEDADASRKNKPLTTTDCIKNYGPGGDVLTKEGEKAGGNIEKGVSKAIEKAGTCTKSVVAKAEGSVGVEAEHYTMQGLAVAPTIGRITHPARTMHNTRRPIATPGWLRPLIRGSTRFSLNAPQWVPVVLRNAPLKLSSLVLRQYYRLVR